MLKNMCHFSLNLDEVCYETPRVIVIILCLFSTNIFADLKLNPWSDKVF